MMICDMCNPRPVVKGQSQGIARQEDPRQAASCGDGLVLVVPRHDPGRGVRLDPCTAMCGYTPSFTKQKQSIFKSSHVTNLAAYIRRTQPQFHLAYTSW